MCSVQKTKAMTTFYFPSKTIIVLNFTFRSACYLELVIVYNTLFTKAVSWDWYFTYGYLMGHHHLLKMTIFISCTAVSMLFYMSLYMCLVPSWNILLNFLCLRNFSFFYKYVILPSGAFLSSPQLLALQLCSHPQSCWPRAGHLKSIPVEKRLYHLHHCLELSA